MTLRPLCSEQFPPVGSKLISSGVGRVGSINTLLALSTIKYFLSAKYFYIKLCLIKLTVVILTGQDWAGGSIKSTGYLSEGSEGGGRGRKVNIIEVSWVGGWWEPELRILIEMSHNLNKYQTHGWALRLSRLQIEQNIILRILKDKS